MAHLEGICRFLSKKNGRKQSLRIQWGGLMGIRKLYKYISEHRWLLILLLALTVLLGSFILERLDAHSVISVSELWKVIGKALWWIGTVIVGAFVWMLKEVFKPACDAIVERARKKADNKNDDDKPSAAGEEEKNASNTSSDDKELLKIWTVLTGIVHEIAQSIAKPLWRKKAVKVPVILAALAVSMAAAADYNTCEKLAGTAVRVYTAVTNVEDDSAPDDGAGKDPIVTDVEMEEYSEEPASVPGPTDPAQFIADPIVTRSLSREEEGWLFFQNAQYHIAAGEDAKSAANKLLPFLQALMNEQCSTTFDRSAPQFVQDQIAAASALESAMNDSEDLDAVIRMRTAIWDEQYCSSTIAWLLANNMQKKAVVIALADNDFKTIEYYYGYSIFWSWRALSFDELDTSAEFILNYIKSRYEDISYYAPEGSSTQRSAQTICSALGVILRETNCRSIKSGTVVIW